MSNVIPFPNSPQASTETIERMRNSVITRKQENSEEMTEICMNVLMECLSESGIDFGDDEAYVKNTALVSEALKSMIYKFHSIEHPLQIVAESLFDHKDGLIQYNIPELEIPKS